ncbi:MAG: hypothetical protein LC775_12510, partial [Acidobacteria bacterium]|nr:hypothetical protein [Acidobacteriota bacterium]
IASLLGLTWAAIRGRVVSKGVPEQAMGAVESSVPMAQKIQSEGIGGIWEWIKDKVGDLKATLLGKITEYLVPTVLVAGITWIISLLNPASAFIKACKAIIDIVTFIIDRGAQIMAFVNAVLDAVIVIAGGGAGGVPGLIETALATAIPVLIGFLAALLGIGGLADKVKKFFQALSKPVMKAVDWVVGKIAAFGKKIWAKLKSKFGKKGKSDKDSRTGADKDRDLQTALKSSHELLKSGMPVHDIEHRLPAIKAKYGLASLNVISRRSGAFDHAYAEGFVQRAQTPEETVPAPEAQKQIQALEAQRQQLLDSAAAIKKRIKQDAQNKLINVPRAYQVDYSKTSLPTDSPVVREHQRRDIQPKGQQYGCHSCSTKTGQFTPDHYPSSKLINVVIDGEPVVKKPVIAGTIEPIPIQQEAQRLYPQCRTCSNKQGGLVSTVTQFYSKLQKVEAETKQLEDRIKKLKGDR